MKYWVLETQIAPGFKTHFRGTIQPAGWNNSGWWHAFGPDVPQFPSLQERGRATFLSAQKPSFECLDDSIQCLSELCQLASLIINSHTLMTHSLPRHKGPAFKHCRKFQRKHFFWWWQEDYAGIFLCMLQWEWGAKRGWALVRWRDGRGKRMHKVAGSKERGDRTDGARRMKLWCKELSGEQFHVLAGFR